jgi:hypothetical protein
MLMIVVSVLVYLFVCARVGRYFRDKNAPMRTKHICGVVALLLNVVPTMFVRSYALMVFGVACGALGYVTIVYHPRWIVGNS